MIRVLLADDQALVRAGFRVLLESAADIEVVREAANGERAVTLVRQARPDVVLLDIRMPVMDGLEATRKITSASDLPGVRVLILTTFEADEYVFEALRAGASGFVLKDIEPAELLEAVRVVARGAARGAPHRPLRRRPRPEGRPLGGPGLLRGPLLRSFAGDARPDGGGGAPRRRPPPVLHHRAQTVHAMIGGQQRIATGEGASSAGLRIS